GFVVCIQNQAFVHIEEAAGQSERVDLVGVNDLDGEGNFGVRVKHYVLAYAIDVLCDYRVVNEFSLTINLCGKLSSQGYLSFKRAAHVGYDAVIDVAATNHSR